MRLIIYTRAVWHVSIPAHQCSEAVPPSIPQVARALGQREPGSVGWEVGAVKAAPARAAARVRQAVWRRTGSDGPAAGSGQCHYIRGELASSLAWGPLTRLDWLMMARSQRIAAFPLFMQSF